MRDEGWRGERDGSQWRDGEVRETGERREPEGRCEERRTLLLAQGGILLGEPSDEYLGLVGAAVGELELAELGRGLRRGGRHGQNDTWGGSRQQRAGGRMAARDLMEAMRQHL